MTDDDARPVETHDSGHTGDYVRTAPASRRARREEHGHALRRALGLTALSVVPGAGLALTRRRRTIGLVLLGAALAAILVVGWTLVSQGVLQGATQFLTRRGILVLFGLICAFAVLGLLSVVLTYRETRAPGWNGRGRWAHRIVAMLACLVVAAPAAQATRYAAIARDALDKMYQSRYTGRGGSAHGPQDGSDPWARTPRVNVLLLGSDAGADRYGQRTDSVTVASINTATGDTVLVTIPRNLQGVPFPADNPLHALWPKGFSCPERVGNECMMDAVWMEAVNHKELFADDESNPGLDTTREVVAEITGLPIDYTAVVDLDGFQQLVDAMGGVWVDVPGPDPGIPIGGKLDASGAIVPGSITGYIRPGYQRLDGYHALWYSRSRVGNAAGDDDRARRQRCMINQLVSQTNPVTMVAKFPDIMKAASDNIRMDIPQDDLPAWATLATTMKRGNMRSVDVSGAVNHVHPDFAKIRTLVHRAITKPHDAKAPTPAKPGSAPASPSRTTPPATASDQAAPSGSSSSASTEAISNTADSC